MKAPKGSTVGVRELRQNLSVYLEQIKTGQTFTVTEHGHAVAELRPLSPASDPMARLIAEGTIARPRSGSGKLPRPLRVSMGRTLSELLNELREDRF